MHGTHADHNDPFQRRIAVFLAVYAALLAFTGMLTNQARTSAILQTAQSSNRWAHFQAKSTKGILTRVELELLDALAPGSRADAGRAALPRTALAAAPAHGVHVTDAPSPSSHAPASPGDDGHAAAPSATVALADPAALRARLVADIARYDAEKDEIARDAEKLGASALLTAWTAFT